MRVLCEMSGGADSLLATCLAKEQFPSAEFHGIFIDYGQPYWIPEFDHATLQAKRLKIALETVRVDGRSIWGSGFGEGDDQDVGPAGGTVEYIPLRNLVIGALAAARAATLGAGMIVSGSKGQVWLPDDSFSFKDSTVPFYTLLEATVNYAADTPVRICPLLALGRSSKMTKEDVYRGLLHRGFRREDTFSCYHPIQCRECSVCRNCVEKKRIWDVLVLENRDRHS